ncbi:MAG: hypothetical protein HFF19_10235 [Oscillospiraceae bacterium]|jgi:hypothetical protein|nr:hypothetical protein [Oscillospiraceae bacterium]
MSADLDARYQIDILAQQAGGYFVVPREQELEYTDLLFDVCKQFGIKYYSATAKERFFVEEVARVTYEREKAQRQGLPLSDVRPAFAS